MQSPPSLKYPPELAASHRACVSHRDKELNNSGGDCRDISSSLLRSEGCSGEGVQWEMPLEKKQKKVFKINPVFSLFLPCLRDTG